MEKRQVVDLILTDDFCLIAALVAELHLNATIGSLNNVKVGEDVAGLVENEP